MHNCNFNTAMIPSTATLVQMPLAQAEKLSKQDACIARVAIPSLVALAGTMSLFYAVGYTIRSAVLLVPRLLTLYTAEICSDAVKIVQCVSSFFALGFGFSIVSALTPDLRQQVVNELTLPLCRSPAEAQTMEEYIESLAALSHKPRQGRVECVGEKALNKSVCKRFSYDEVDIRIPFTNLPTIEDMKKEVFDQVEKDLSRTREFWFNDANLAALPGIQEDVTKKKVVENTIYKAIDDFYRETERGLTDNERLQKVLLVMLQLHQGGAGCATTKIYSLANLSLEVHPKQIGWIIQCQVDIKKKQLTVIQTLSMDLWTMAALQKNEEAKGQSGLSGGPTARVAGGSTVSDGMADDLTEVSKDSTEVSELSGAVAMVTAKTRVDFARLQDSTCYYHVRMTERE